MPELLFSLIEEAKTICIFRHQIPDPDALGSQWGLVTWLKDNYPDKHIYALGKHIGVKPELFEAPDVVSDDVIEGSLAIVCDTANAARIDDQRVLSAKTIIQIDHHPQSEHYAAVEWVDPTSASTCEIVTKLLKDRVGSQALSEKVARYLYMGILTDTIKFSTNNTTYRSLEMAAYLAQSSLDLPLINENLFSMTMVEYKFINYIRQHAVIESDGLVYIYITIEMMSELNITANLAKERISELGNVRDFEIWVMFVEHQENEVRYFNGSMRSRKVTINDIAAKYHGGGHKHAAAVKGLDNATIQRLLDDLHTRIREG